MSAFKSVGAAEDKEGSLIVKEPHIDEATTGIVIETPDEERPLMESEAIEELPALTDTAVTGPEESLSITTETVIETAFLTESPIQINEVGPSRAEALVADVPIPQADEVEPSGLLLLLLLSLSRRAYIFPQVNSRSRPLLQVQLWSSQS